MWENYENFENSKTEEKEFYYYLGLLSTKFASLETCLIDLIGCALKINVFKSNIILERNSLSQNVDLLRRIIKYNQWEKERIEKIISKISAVRGNRNLFIHGIWNKPFQRKNGKFYVSCREAKLELLNINSQSQFTFGKVYTFELNRIKNLTWEIRDIVVEIEEIFFDREDGLI